MNLDTLRARHNARQQRAPEAVAPQTIEQKVDTYANAEHQMIGLKFSVPCDHLNFSRDQAKKQVEDMINACKHIGVKVTQELKWE